MSLLGTPPIKQVKRMGGWVVLLTLLITGISFSVLATTDLHTTLDAPQITIEGKSLLRDDLNAFYVARNYSPVWSFSGPDNLKALDAFIHSVTEIVSYHGLDLRDYPIEPMRKLAASSDDQDKTNLELMVTDTLLRLAHALHGDNHNLKDLYLGWIFQHDPIDIPGKLAAAITSHTLKDYISGLAPKNVAYDGLAHALETYRGYAVKGGWVSVDPGTPLRPNDRSSGIAQLRARLAAEDYPVKTETMPQQNETFDADLVKVVQSWQLRNGLEPDGHIGKISLDILNESVQDKIDHIRANMERWRHMPDGFPPNRSTIVNIASASIEIFNAGKAIYRDPVVIGRVDRKTPFIQSQVRSMIINPIWHVPLKIAQKDILPKLRKNRHYLQELGFVISGNTDDPYGENIDWAEIQEHDFHFRLRQQPGDDNSLGQLKFDFDNPFAVYMHGTPHQDLFAKAQRNFSSGCIRLRDPEQVAELLLASNDRQWTVDKIEEEINKGKTHWMSLKEPMPLYVLYWTVFIDEAGTLNFRKDVYGYDGILK